MANIREAETLYSRTNVTLTTTTEGVVITSPLVTIPADAVQVLIWAWGQLTTGASTTTVTPRIRRGTTITGALIGEANAEDVKAAAGSIEPYMIMLTEDVTQEDRIQYSFTLQQAGATGNGTVQQASILVLVF